MRVCFAALLLFSFFCIGCKKTGPQGATGATGANGPAGPIGPAGNNGSVIYSGTVTPAASVGNVGDFYMDLTTSTLYGPKTASGWGSGFSFKGDSGVMGAQGDSGATGAQGDSGATGANGATGATGANGKAGTQIYAGTGVPDPTLGVTGDFYMDTVAHNLYGPKQTAGWGTPIALQGPTGATGATGATGPQGPAGTANVLYTPWVTPTSWSHLVGYGSQDIVRHTELIPAITAAIVQGGTVLCYAQLDDYNTTIWPDGQIGQMPITVMFKYNGVEAIDTWEITIATGSSAIEVYDSNNNYLTSTFTESLFRWVIIPGGSAVSGSVPRQKQVSHGETFQR